MKGMRSPTEVPVSPTSPVSVEDRGMSVLEALVTLFIMTVVALALQGGDLTPEAQSLVDLLRELA